MLLMVLDKTNKIKTQKISPDLSDRFTVTGVWPSLKFIHQEDSARNSVSVKILPPAKLCAIQYVTT